MAVHQVGRCLVWHALRAGFLKVNVDASFFSETSCIGVGMVIRDEGGIHIMGQTKLIVVSVDVKDGEALGFYEALSCIKELGLEKVVTEAMQKWWWML